MNDNYELDESVVNTIILSGTMSPNPEFSSRKAFLVSLFLNPDTPFYRYIISNGVSRYELWERAISILKEPDEQPQKLLHVTINGGEFFLDYVLSDLFTEAFKIARRSYGRSQISVTDLIEAFGELCYSEYIEFLATFIPGYEAQLSAKKPKFEVEAPAKEKFIIPDKLKSYLTNLNETYSADEKECKICGRDAELKQLTQILMKTKKRNAVLIGEPGVGKTAIVEKLTWMIATGNCPEKFKDSVVISLDVTSIIAGTKFRGTAEERFNDLIVFLENNPQCILFIDEIHLLLGAGACFEGALDLANALKPLLARGNTRVIGATTEQEYTKYFSKDGALKRRFEKIVVREPLYKNVYSMIENQVKHLEEIHKAKISKHLVETAIFYASCFNYETRNPDRTLDLIDRSLANAEIAGKTKVTKRDILDNFSINENKFKSMPIETKMATAYHEAGHYILRRYSPELIDFRRLAVSIVPAENYLGVNVCEIDPDITPSNNRSYFIQLIGGYLAGRLAEEKYSSKHTADASDDLEKATQIAKNMVTKYGLDMISSNRVFSSNSENAIPSEQIYLKIDERVNAILTEAGIYANKILAEHSMHLKALAEALSKSGIMSEKEISDLFEQIDLQNS